MEFNTICQEWTRGPLIGRIFHSPIPFSRIGNVVEVGCHNCGTYLYTYEEVK